MPMRRVMYGYQPASLYIILALSICYFSVQLVLSHLTHALTLLMASYHMLCNIFALTGSIINIKHSDSYRRDDCYYDKVENVADLPLKDGIIQQQNDGKERTNEETTLTESNIQNKHHNQPHQHYKQKQHNCRQHNDGTDRQDHQHMEQKSKTYNTFGWARIEILTILIVCITLASLSFSLLVEALQTIVHIDHQDCMHLPIHVMILGLVGLLLNGFTHFLIGGYTAKTASTSTASVAASDAVSAAAIAASTGSLKMNGTNHILTSNSNILSSISNAGIELELCPDAIISVDNCQATNDTQISTKDYSTNKTALRSHSNNINGHSDSNNINCTMNYIGNNIQQKQIHTDPNGINNDRIVTTNQNCFKPIYDTINPEQRYLMMNDHRAIDFLRDISSTMFVIVCAIIVQLAEDKGHTAILIDPVLSIFSCILVVALSYPYMKEACMILLQTIPGSINMGDFEKALINKFPQIVSYHDLHIWQLSPYKYIATVHIVFHKPTYYTNLINEIRAHFYEYSIAHVTIQPEFFTNQQQQLRMKRRSFSPFSTITRNPSIDNTNDINLSNYSECLIQCSRPECLDKVCCRDSMSNLQEIYSIGNLQEDNYTIKSSPSPSTATTVTGNTTITMISNNNQLSTDCSEQVEGEFNISNDGRFILPVDEAIVEPLATAAALSAVEEIQCLKNDC